VAEREGFEPTVLFRYSRFPGVRLKPLSHLSTGNQFEGLWLFVQSFSGFGFEKFFGLPNSGILEIKRGLQLSPFGGLNIGRTVV
jgi:hypothetical protein